MLKSVGNLNEKFISVGKMNNKQRPGLYIFQEPNILVKVATFRNDSTAEEFMKYMCEMLEVKYEP